MNKEEELLKKLGLDKRLPLSKKDRMRIKKDMRELEDMAVRCVISDVYADDVKNGIISKKEAESDPIIKAYLQLNKSIHPDK